MNDLDGRSLTVVVPAWNEQEIIVDSIERLRGALDDLVAAGRIDSWQLAVVDDGSVDATAALVEDLARAHPGVRLVRRDQNGGLGAALRTGFATATTGLVFYTDADLPAPLAAIGEAIDVKGRTGADIVSARRRARGVEGRRRHVYSIVWNGLTRTVLGLRVHDPNFAVKLLDRAVLEAVELRSDGSFVDAELLARADRAGFRIAQFEVDHLPRPGGISTLSSPGVIARMLFDLARFGPGIRLSRRRS